MTDQIETRIGFDTKRLQENKRNAIKKVREQQVSLNRRQDAWNWYFPRFEHLLDDTEVVQTYFNDSLSTLTIDFLAFHKKEVEEIVEYFSDHPDLDLEKQGWGDNRKDYMVSSWNKCVIYQFYPRMELWEYMRNRFNLNNSRIYMEVQLRFFPQEGGECEIYEEEIVTETNQRVKLGFRCKEGASAW